MSDYSYQGYLLTKNPFKWERRLYPPYDNRVEPSLSKFVYQREINFILYQIEKALKEHKDQALWFWYPKEAGLFYEIDFYSAFFRSLSLLEKPRFYLSDVLLPHIVESPLHGLYRLSVLRITRDAFRQAFYSFFFRQLEQLSQAGQLTQVFPEGERILALPSGERENFLDEIFFYQEESQKERGEEEKIEVEEKEEEKEEKKELKEKILEFLERLFESQKVGEAVKHAFQRVIIRKSWDEALVSLQEDPVINPEATLVGWINFLNFNYDKVIFFFDQMEKLIEFDDDLQASLIGSISQVQFLLKGKSLFLFFASGRERENLFPFVRGKELEINFWPIFQSEEISNFEGAKEAVISFLNRDPYRDERKEGLEGKERTFPFTQEALFQIYQASEGNFLNFLEKVGEVLEKGRERNFSPIDTKLISEILK